MSSVMSATTNQAFGATASLSRRDRFFSSAHELMAQAQADYSDGAYGRAMESSYRAALRVAGAVNADSPKIRKRKRLPASAWDKLALTGSAGKRWAETFSAFSRERGRVASGIELHPDPAMVGHLLELTSQFLEESLPGSPQSTLVA